MKKIKQAKFDDKYADSVDNTGNNINEMGENNEQSLS
tara:strand:- start:284 stop:394 length:111 start_codon:yes stop_codon:yes gene_type:complete